MSVLGFPIQLPKRFWHPWFGWYPCPHCVPWSLVAPHKQQALDNHGQTLRRLAERGGLSPAELLCVLDDTDCERIFSGELTDERAAPVLELLIKGYDVPKARRHP